MTVTEEFIRKILLFPEEGEVHLSSLDNNRAGSSERHILTRDPEKLLSWVERMDEPGRGTFFCVSTIKPRSKRNKANSIQSGLVHLDVDLKSVDLTFEEIQERLEGLSYPPSWIISSGNGLHAYWLLNRPHTGPEIEPVLKKFQKALGGDPMVTHSAALMRLPGTHNSKNDAWKEVRPVLKTDIRYGLDELEEWDVPITILPRGAEPPNPFTQLAQDQGFTAPIDVDARLAAMKHKGAADQAIHPTQLSVTAALMGRGWEEDDVVAKVLEATKAAAPKGETWNWKKEEQIIRAMCRDYEHKVTVEAKRDGKVVNLADARKTMQDGKKGKKDPPAKKAKAKDAHVILARGMMAELAQQGRAVIFTEGQTWIYENRLWRMVPPAEEKAWIDRGVERGCQALNIISKNTLVNETRGYLMRQPELHRDKIEWDDHGMIATRSQLIDPETKEPRGHEPDDWITRFIDCEYDPRAKCPNWERMIGDTLGEKEVLLLQEIMGSFLIENRPRSLRRALVFLGASNTGKSSLINTIAHFFSRDENTATFEILENSHGLMPFLESKPWVQHEAFEQGRWHFSATAKALLSADPVHVNIKNGPMVSFTFKQPIVWGTNVPPQFKESTKAMQNRLIVVKCEQEFGAEPVGVAKIALEHGYDSPSEFVLATERSGMLNWALEGLDRLRARGFFELPEDVEQTMHEMWLQSNVVAGFVEECCDVDPTKMITNMDFVGAFRLWWEENRGDQRVPSPEVLGKSLAALGLGIVVGKYRDRSFRYYGRVALNESGLDLWQGFTSSRAAVDGAIRLSERREDVNKDIPEDWG